MSKGKKNEPFDPRNMKPEDVLKFEIATELGLGDKVIKDGWRSLSAKEKKKGNEERGSVSGRGSIGSRCLWL